MELRIGTFNLENLDDGADVKPPLPKRIEIMRPQLERMCADIVFFQEVNSQTENGKKTISALTQLIDGTPYQTYDRVITTTKSGDYYSERNLIILSKYKLSDIKIVYDTDGPRPSYKMQTSIPNDTQAKPLEWERPILYAKAEIGQGEFIHLFNVHLKSKLATTIPGQKIDNYTWKSPSAWAEGSFISSMKRLGQAVQVRQLIDGIFDESDDIPMIVVAGDFNSTEEDFPVQAICGPVEETGNPDHVKRTMIPCERNVADSSRFSLYHLGKGQMLDHVLVSRGLFKYFKGAEIHNETLPDESGAFRDDTKFPESDHAPVIAGFSIG